jgi:hypothetical protein
MEREKQSFIHLSIQKFLEASIELGNMSDLPAEISW